MAHHFEFGLGWQRDLPDMRDYTAEHEEIRAILGRSRALRAGRARLSASVDLRQWCPPVENQGSLGSCTAQAGVGLIEYLERRAFGKHLDASRLFLYKVTRNLLEWTGDTGAFLRTTMGAMVLFGVPPERYWPYVISSFDDEPLQFCYAFAQNFKANKYYRLDPPGTSASELLNRVRRFIAAGYPSMFGFTVYSSMPGSGDGKGEIPYPEPGDSVRGGHAVVAVGYDDGKRIGSRRGALLIRNSWGTGWGENGYGWLPYAYVESGLAVDFWTLIKKEYVDTGKFE
jgi:C1A family cysteine protease